MVRHANPTDFLPVLTSFVVSIVPGIVTVFFCQCMGVLLSPTNRKHKSGGIRWGLSALTTAMFLFSTTTLALNLSAVYPAIHYRDGRSLARPGLLRYLITFDIPSTIPLSLISLNQWLADGLLVSSVSKSVVQAS